MELSIVIVNWNTKSILEKCLSSINKETKNISYEIIVVDNGSNDGSIEMIRNNFTNVKLISNKFNIGYSRANNIGIKKSCGKYVCLLNSDTVIIGRALEKIVRFLDINKEVGGVTCQLLNSNKTPQFSTAYGEVNLIHIISVETGLYRKFPHSKIWGKPLLSYLDLTRTQEVEVCPSVAITLRMEIMYQIGMLDENIFFGTIDWDLSNRIRKEGWKLFYYPNAKVIHFGGKSKDPIRKDLLIKDYYARYYYFKKHYGATKMNIYRSLTMLFSVLKIIIFSGLYLIKFNNSESKKYLARIKEYFLRLCIGLRLKNIK